MSYLEIEYRLVPTQSFTVIRSCAGCGGKAPYKNTGKFRVNANGSKIDVWLIYQCGKCRHTFNLTIYERRKNTDIPAAEYQRFLDNDTQLAEEYGREIALFQKNRAEIDHKSITYELIRLRHPTVGSICAHPIRIAIQNPYSLKIRPEKLAAEILGRSASQVKKEIAKGTITIEFIKGELTMKLAMKIETDRLIIRSLRPDDEQAFIEMASDGSLTEIFGDCSKCSHWMGKWIAESIQLEQENNPARAYLAYCVERKSDHTIIGSVGCTYYEDMKRIGITYFLGADHRGHGYMAEAVKGYVQYFFQHYDADALFATARVENKSSCQTLERAGFQLLETRLYKDLYDETAEMSNFYELRNDCSPLRQDA